LVFLNLEPGTIDCGQLGSGNRQFIISDRKRGKPQAWIRNRLLEVPIDHGVGKYRRCPIWPSPAEKMKARGFLDEIIAPREDLIEFPGREK
jgi:hypothetical protein